MPNVVIKQEVGEKSQEITRNTRKLLYISEFITLGKGGNT